MKKNKPLTYLKKEEIEQLQLAKNFMLTHLDRHDTIRELAKKTGMNQNKLKAGFKLLFGSSPYHFLLRARMQKAQVLLQQTNEPLKAIAPLVGYRNPKNFITGYKRYFGKSPGATRKS